MRWDTAIDAVTADISTLVDQNVPPNFIIKLRSEVTAIDRPLAPG